MLDILLAVLCLAGSITVAWLANRHFRLRRNRE